MPPDGAGNVPCSPHVKKSAQLCSTPS